MILNFDKNMLLSTYVSLSIELYKFNSLLLENEANLHNSNMSIVDSVKTH